MEDIDLDEFFREIQDGRGARLPSLPAPPVTVETKEEEETMRWLEEAPPLPLPHPPPADVVVVVEETRKCLPSPALSVDSGVSSASSEAPAVDGGLENVFVISSNRRKGRMRKLFDTINRMIPLTTISSKKTL